jgi:preprotein translocase subunit SecG
MSGFPFLAAVSFFMNLIAVLFVICCIILILIILVQKGKGGGLSSAFGGGMASGILGSKTGDFLTWVTIIFVGVMLILAAVLAKYYKPGPSAPTGATTAPQSQQQPVTPSTTKPAPATNTTGQTSNNNNSLALPSGTSSAGASVPTVENNVGEGESTSQSSDTNQPAN